MSYEYADCNGALIKIGPTVDNKRCYIQVRDPDASLAGYVSNEDAPAVALAILEAAGIEPSIAAFDESAELFEARAVTYLQQGQAARRRAEASRVREAEREAEDAKVDAWRRRAPLPGQVLVEWKYLSDYERKEWGKDYRIARDFFQQEDDANTAQALRDLGICDHDEKPAPRVLQYGDPEPDRGTRWMGKAGPMKPWFKRLDGRWTRDMDSPGCSWRAIPESHFPMTEVTR